MIKAALIAVLALSAVSACASQPTYRGPSQDCDAGGVTVSGNTSAGVASGGQIVSDNDIVFSGSRPVGNCDSGVRVGFNLGTGS